MNPYQIVGVITLCASLFAGIVGLLAMQGMPVLTAFICVYAVAVWFMLSLQRRARQAADEGGHSYQRITDRETNVWGLPASNNAVMVSEYDRRESRRFGA